jgi:exonuclease III
MRILTYNIFGVPWSRINITKTADWIFSTNANIICLQEVFSIKHRLYLIERGEKEEYVAYYPSDNSCIPFFECGSGLITFVKNTFRITAPSRFEPFQNKHGADRCVQKGYFIVNLTNGLHVFQVYNTHMQSDITEFWCWRINYDESRKEQESQLFISANANEFPIVVGDMNTFTFDCFEKVDTDFHVTFPGTGEHLDNLICLSRDRAKIDYIDTKYHDEVTLSDHIPIIYTIDLLRRTGRSKLS